MFALVLALVAPLISQLRAAAPHDGLPASPICSATGNTLVAHAEPDAPSDARSAGHFDRCGYCGLLAGHPPLQFAVLLSASPAVGGGPPPPRGARPGPTPPRPAPPPPPRLEGGRCSRPLGI
ncbi:DUF2946 domain-containing protein [Burkholderia contaminans]|uniref:DUF2946 domain-containing protein n=1 Tax=Burkholderia contaminans TaxID=488447 RepID=UPI001C98BF44|nr:DUF2946 domain-containing protein [Burkholderia contaminans]MBY4827107.1 DUF2946 domain-containing protein [Burkholderia contaminans]